MSDDGRDDGVFEAPRGGPGEPERVSPDGVTNEPSGSGDEESGEDIQSPGKIIRIGSMVKQLLDEVNQTTLDEEARDSLRDIYENSLEELRTALSPELANELDRLTLGFDDDTIPTEAQ